MSVMHFIICDCQFITKKKTISSVMQFIICNCQFIMKKKTILEIKFESWFLWMHFNQFILKNT